MIDLLDIPKLRYIEINGQICTRTEGNVYSTKDEADDACSANEYCIGFMQRKFDLYNSCPPPFYCEDGENRDRFQLCFNKGNLPFTDEDPNGNVIGQEYISYKKKNSGKT